MIIGISANQGIGGDFLCHCLFDFDPGTVIFGAGSLGEFVKGIVDERFVFRRTFKQSLEIVGSLKYFSIGGGINASQCEI